MCHINMCHINMCHINMCHINMSCQYVSYQYVSYQYVMSICEQRRKTSKGGRRWIILSKVAYLSQGLYCLQFFSRMGPALEASALAATLRLYSMGQVAKLGHNNP